MEKSHIDYEIFPRLPSQRPSFGRKPLASEDVTLAQLSAGDLRGIEEEEEVYPPPFSGNKLWSRANAAARLQDSDVKGPCLFLFRLARGSERLAHLAGHSQLLLRHLRRLPQHVDLGAPADQGHVATYKIWQE